MFYIKIISYWGLFITLIILLSPMSLTVIDYLPGILIMSLFYFIFAYGSQITKDKRDISCINDISVVKYEKRNLSLIFSLLFMLFSLYYIRFYTGMSFGTVLRNIIEGKSNYMFYQNYFKETGLYKLTFNKLFIIILNGIFKAGTILIIIKTFAFQYRIKILDIANIVIIITTMLYMSLARGTNFEVFEIVVIVLFGILLRLWRFKRFWQFNYLLSFKRTIKFSLKKRIFLVIAAIIVLLAFRFNLESRGAGTLRVITNELVYEENFLSFLFPSLGLLLFWLSGYFTFGLFFLSTLFYKITFGSISGFFAFLLPFGKYLLGGDYNFLICDVFIDCRVTWVPDIVTMISYFGFFGSMLILFFLGIFAARLAKNTLTGSVLSSVLLFFIVYFIFSLPVGNFITISSSNKLAIVFTLLLYSLPKSFNIFPYFLKTETFKPTITIKSNV